MSSRPLRVAVIGAGLMGRAHAAAACRNGASVISVSDPDPVKARNLAAATAGGAAIVPVDDVFSRRDATIVHVCTPPADHFDIVSRALEAGMHVICEKPLAQSAARVEELCANATSNGVALCPVHQLPFQHGAQRILAARESLGAVRHIAAEICTAGASGSDEATQTRVAADILPHPLSLSRAFGAAPLAGARWQLSAPMAGELVITGVAGAIGLSFLVSTHGRPTSNSLRVIGEKGTATLDLFHGYAFFERGYVSRLRKISRPFVVSALTFGSAAVNGARRGLAGETAFPGLRELVGRFYASIADGSPAPISFEESVDIARARDAIISLFPFPARS